MRLSTLIPLGGLAAALLGAPFAGMALAERADRPRARFATAATGPAVPGIDSAAAPSARGDFVGVLLPPQMANLTARGEETVLDVPVRVGGTVHKGDIVVNFDLAVPRRELAMAQAELREMRAQAAAAGAELAAARGRAARRAATVDVLGQSVALVSGEEIAQSRFDAQGAAARWASAAARIAQTKEKIEQLELTMHEKELRAPFDGVVAAIHVEAGATAHLAEVIARVVGGEGLRVRIAVPEEASALLAASKRAELVVDGALLHATLREVPPEPDPVTRTFIVDGSVEDLESACGTRCVSLAGRTVRASLEAPAGGKAP